MKKVKRILPLLSALAMLFGWIVSANAELLPRLGGAAVYDTDLDITWLSDANAGAGSSFDDGVPGDGRMSWANAKAWADSLTVGGFTDWRLPTALNQDSTGQCGGFNCTGSEMGHLFYIELAGTAGFPISTSGDPDLPLFSNIQVSNVGDWYWTSTDFLPIPIPASAWQFGFRVGNQGAFNKLSKFFAWAVRDGDPEAVAKVLTQTAIIELTAIMSAIQAGVPNVGDIEKASKRLNKAKGSLVTSLNSFQPTDPSRLIVDPLLPDGTAFFGHSKDAVKKIFKTIQDGGITNLTLLIQLENVVVGKVLKASKMAAQVSIDDAQNSGGNTEDITAAEIAIETGNQLTNNGINVGISALSFFDAAVTSYENAWEFSQKATGALPE